jgi:hypothetical protein
MQEVTTVKNISLIHFNFKISIMPNPKIRFSPAQIPIVKEPMLVMKMGDPVVRTEDLLRKMARSLSPNLQFQDLGQSGARGAYDGKRLVAYLNPKTGESRIFPSLETLKPAQGLAERAKAVAQKMLSDKTLFPDDGTRAIALTPIVLNGTKRSRDKNERPITSQYLSYVKFQRQVNGIPVYGAGTRAMVAVGADDVVHGFSHQWRKAIATDAKVAPLPVDEIAKSILRQLDTYAKTSDVRVDKVKVCYHDGGKGVMQPVYRFEATIIATPSTDKRVSPANRHVFGYVSIGNSVAALPTLGEMQGKPPLDPPAKQIQTEKKVPVLDGDPLVGRYVVRNDTVEWVNSANEFWSSLHFAETLFGGHVPFTDSQYFWAEPRLFTNEKDTFINNVHIALNEVHGNWDLFSTRDNSHDIVSLSSIPSSGYGNKSGVTLAYWILHSCEVIPTQTDEATSFDIWWKIFKGLHAVVGYRTEMWIDDDVMGPFGFMMGLGAAVVPAWLHEVSSNDSYDDGATYHDDNRNMTEPMGRASAVVVCGHSDDTANNIGNIGAANCLTEWWFNN